MPDSSSKVPFDVGDSVRVTDDCEDSATPGWDISGWQGRVADITDAEPPMLLVEWDSITLKEMPGSLIEEAERTGGGWRQYYLFPRDVEAAEPRDAPQDVKQICRRLHDQHHWVSLGKEGRYIQQVLEQAESDDEPAIFHAWEETFSDCLSVPFEASVAAPPRGTLFRMGDNVHVTSITFLDCLYGFIATVQREGLTKEIPLADLEPLDETSDHSLPLRAYRTWFANH